MTRREIRPRAAGEADQPLPVGRQLGPVERGGQGTPVGRRARAGVRDREEPAEVGVARLGRRDERQVGAAGQRHLGSRDRPSNRRKCCVTFSEIMREGPRSDSVRTRSAECAIPLRITALRRGSFAR